MASKVKGLERLIRQMRALPQKQVEAVQASLAQGSEELAESIRRAAPDDTGKLRRSIGWAQGDAPKTKATGAFREHTSKGDSIGRALNKAGLRFTVFAGDDDAFYARWVEFGRSAQAARAPRRNKNYRRTDISTKAYRAVAAAPAQPFFFPTLRAYKKRLKSRVVRNANKAAKAAAAVR